MKFSWIVFLLVPLGILSGCVGLTPKPIFTSTSEAEKHKSVASSQLQQEKIVGNLASKGRKTTIGLPLKEREKIMQQVEKYLGVPYRWGGMSNNGIDCSGFVVVVFRDALGVLMPHSTSKLYSLGETVTPQDLGFGDLVFFRDVGRRQLLHVGIFLGGARFAHASTSKGVTISSLQDNYYRTRFLGARRILNAIRNKH